MIETTTRIAEPEAAAALLRLGQVIHYEPGDATRYTCVLVSPVSALSGPHVRRRWLIVENHGILLDLSEGRQWPLHEFVRVPRTRGCWRALRPLLAALGAAEGGLTMDTQDAIDEGELR